MLLRNMKSSPKSSAFHVLVWFLFSSCITGSNSETTDNSSVITTTTITPTTITNQQPLENPFKLNLCCDLNLSFMNHANDSGTSSCLETHFNDNNDGNGPAATKNSEFSIPFPANLITNKLETTFKLIINQPKCGSGEFVLHNFTIMRNEENPEFVMQPDGYLRTGQHSIGSEYYNLRQYCINGINKSYAQIQFQFKTCRQSCTPQDPCLQKCCPLDQVVTVYGDQWHCEEGFSKLSPIYYEVTNQTNTIAEVHEKEKILSKNAFYYIRNPKTWSLACNKSLATIFARSPVEGDEHPIKNFKNITFHVGEDGEIFYRTIGSPVGTPLDYSCIDGYRDHNTSLGPKDPVDQRIIFACKLSSSSQSVKEPQNHSTYGVISIICSIFALLTFLVYLILWEKQDAHGWTIMTFCLTVFFFFLFVGIAHLSFDGENDMSAANSSGICKMIAMSCQFFFVAMFSWLMMLTLDLWSAFRSVTHGDSRTKNLYRYIFYCIFGWGIPFLVIFLSVAFPDKNGNSNKNKIQVLQQHCVITTKSLWKFMYGPSIACFTFTILFFILTTKKLIEYKRCTDFSTNAIPNGKSYTLFVKLLCVIVLIWICEAIAWILRESNSSAIAWKLFYSINWFAPVAIFVIFVLRWDILKALAEKSSLLNFILTPALWTIALWRPSMNFQTTSYEEDDLLIDETSPLSSPRNTTAYTGLHRSEAFDEFDETENKA